MTDVAEPILTVRGLSKTFSVSSGLFSTQLKVSALSDINLDVRSGETLGIVGESGCGKSTLGRSILRLIDADSGEVNWRGRDIAGLANEELRRLRSELQIIFQDPLASLNPRMTVGEIIADPLRTLFPEMPAKERRARVLYMMESVGLLPEMINRYPHEFSGGQAQRIGIARALVTEPRLIVCDEPVSALDVSIQAQILNLLADLKERFSLTLIFISHDLSVVHHVSDMILVLYLGRMVELAPAETLYEDAKHPYTATLLKALPIPDPKVARTRSLEGLKGEVPSPFNPPSGCGFRTRCPFAIPKCADVVPKMEPAGDRRLVACHRWKEITAG